jgi:hypothetical protein
MLLMFFTLFFYRLGASNIEGLLNYPFWRDMGSMMSNEDFIALRSDHLWKIYPLLVAPVCILVIVTAVLAWSGAPPVPRWVFVGALACQLIMVGSTALIQIPIQIELSQSGFDRALLDRLISTDLMFRKLPSLAEGAFVLCGLWIAITRRF